MLDQSGGKAAQSKLGKPSRPSAPAAARSTVTSQRQRHPREGLYPVPAPAVWTTGGVQNQGSHRWSFQSVTSHATSFCRCPVTPLSKKNKLVQGPSRPPAPAAVRATVASQRQRHPRRAFIPCPLSRLSNWGRPKPRSHRGRPAYKVPLCI